MKNREYWKSRFLALESDQVKNAKSLVDRLEKEWFRTTKEIEKEIISWYSKFAKDNNMDMATAKTILSFGEMKEFRWSVEDYITKAKENVLNGNWEKELNNAYTKQRVSRLQAIDMQLRERIEDLYNKEYLGLKDLAENVYTDTYYKSIFEIEKGFGVGSSFNIIDNRRIEKLLATGWTSDNRTFSDRIWVAKEKLITTLQTELTQNIIMGEAPDRFIRVLGKIMNTDKNNAARLVMTESAFFYSSAQKDVYKELEVEKYEYLATLDMNTSELCQGMDGQVFDIKDYIVGVTAPPLHPWCRSVTVPYFADSFGERFARGEDGKTYTVPEDMTYEKWRSIPRMNVNDIIKGQFKEYKEDELNKLTKDLDEMLKGHTNKESKWSGSIVLGNEQRYGKLWNCDIITNKETSESILSHELLHARSISHYEPQTYVQYSNIEEAAVELFNREIFIKEGMPYLDSGYDELIEKLEEFSRFVSYDDKYDFAKTLFEVDVKSRKSWLEDILEAHISRNKETINIKEAFQIMKELEVF